MSDANGTPFNSKVNEVKVKSGDKLKCQISDALMVPLMSLLWFWCSTRFVLDTT